MRVSVSVSSNAGTNIGASMSTSRSARDLSNMLNVCKASLARRRRARSGVTLDWQIRIVEAEVHGRRPTSNCTYERLHPPQAARPSHALYYRALLVDIARPSTQLSLALESLDFDTFFPKYFFLLGCQLVQVHCDFWAFEPLSRVDIVISKSS